jgi:hypothetical protein
LKRDPTLRRPLKELRLTVDKSNVVGVTRRRKEVTPPPDKITSEETITLNREVQVASLVTLTQSL